MFAALLTFIFSLLIAGMWSLTPWISLVVVGMGYGVLDLALGEDEAS